MVSEYAQLLSAGHYEFQFVIDQHIWNSCILPHLCSISADLSSLGLILLAVCRICRRRSIPAGSRWAAILENTLPFQCHTKVTCMELLFFLIVSVDQQIFLGIGKLGPSVFWDVSGQCDWAVVTSISVWIFHILMNCALSISVASQANWRAFYSTMQEPQELDSWHRKSCYVIFAGCYFLCRLWLMYL